MKKLFAFLSPNKKPIVINNAQFIYDVIDISLAYELKALGVQQKSLFYWTKAVSDGKIIYYPDYLQPDKEKPESSISAFTVGELHRMLPMRIYFEGNDYFFHSTRASKWLVDYRTQDENKKSLFNTYRSDSREQNAAANLLILILREKVIKIEELNKRIY